MSGGHFNYSNDRCCDEIFDYLVSANYGLAEDVMKFQSNKARRLNPLGDHLISELVFDVFCLLHSYDWYVCSDTCKKTYLEDVQYFKDKWLKPLSGDRAKEIVDEEIDNLRSELYRTFGIEGGGTADEL